MVSLNCHPFEIVARSLFQKFVYDAVTEPNAYHKDAPNDVDNSTTALRGEERQLKPLNRNSHLLK